jgi:hypothetical protein
VTSSTFLTNGNTHAGRSKLNTRVHVFSMNDIKK